MWLESSILFRLILNEKHLKNKELPQRSKKLTLVILCTFIPQKHRVVKPKITCCTFSFFIQPTA